MKIMQNRRVAMKFAEKKARADMRSSLTTAGFIKKAGSSGLIHRYVDPLSGRIMDEFTAYWLVKKRN